MKNFLLLLIISSMGIKTFAQNDIKSKKEDHSTVSKGYFANVDLSFGGTFPKHYPKGIIDVSTTHGYQFSPRFSLGVGVGTYNTVTLNGYLQAKFNFRNKHSKREHFPYLALRGGYSWSTHTGDHFGDDKGPLIEPRFGWSHYTKIANLRWNVFFTPSFYQFYFIPKVGLSFEF